MSERELQPQTWNFYPRSPCGERPCDNSTGFAYIEISIHALLAESDCNEIAGRNPPIHFYPRSPCGERRPPKPHKQVPALFLSTLSLRRATIRFQISQSGITNFYPRSPCGERQCWKRHKCRKSQKFLSTLSLRRATDKVLEAVSRNGISIHALLAESDPFSRCGRMTRRYFYPRSPCGERPAHCFDGGEASGISIHALLAESDYSAIYNSHCKALFLSTLSLRRATCAGRPRSGWKDISIHALLAESDL